jgi:hypothetical protein
MKLSEKIKELQETLEKHGDLELMQPGNDNLDEKWESCKHSPVVTLSSGKKVVWL